MGFLRPGLAIAFVVSSALTASAQSVSIRFEDGLVTLSAKDAPVRSVLAEWARVGGAKVVNGDRVGGEPVTLELTAVPERQALDVLLRRVSGYIVAARQAASSGGSTFDRILILPTSAPPPPRPAGPPLAAAPPAPQPPPPSVFVPGSDPEENPPDDVAPGPNRQPVSPAQVQQRLREAAARAAAQRGDARPPEDQPPQTPAPAQPTRGNPFGNVRGSSRPGVITPVPQQQPPQQQRNPLRPNGDPEP